MGGILKGQRKRTEFRKAPRTIYDMKSKRKTKNHVKRKRGGSPLLRLDTDDKVGHAELWFCVSC